MWRNHSKSDLRNFCSINWFVSFHSLHHFCFPISSTSVIASAQGACVLRLPCVWLSSDTATRGPFSRLIRSLEPRSPANFPHSIITARRRLLLPDLLWERKNYHNFHFLLVLLSFGSLPIALHLFVVFPHTNTHRSSRSFISRSPRCLLCGSQDLRLFALHLFCWSFFLCVCLLWFDAALPTSLSLSLSLSLWSSACLCEILVHFVTVYHFCFYFWFRFPGHGNLFTLALKCVWFN